MHRLKSPRQLAALHIWSTNWQCNSRTEVFDTTFTNNRNVVQKNVYLTIRLIIRVDPPCLRSGFRDFQTHWMIDIPILGYKTSAICIFRLHAFCLYELVSYCSSFRSLWLRHYRVWFEIQLAKYAWQIASYNFVLFNNLNEVCIIQNKANLQWQIQLSMCLKITPFLPQNRGIWGFLSPPSWS